MSTTVAYRSAQEPAGEPFAAPEAPQLMASLGVSLTEALHLQALLTHDWAGPSELPQLSYSARQIIYTLRRKLQKNFDVYIVNDGRGRYSIPSRDKAKLFSVLKV